VISSAMLPACRKGTRRNYEPFEEPGCLAKLAPDSPIRPGAGLGNIIEADSPGTSSYNALWLTLHKRFTHGLQFNSSYTFSKSFDDVSQNNNIVLLQNSLDVRDARRTSCNRAIRYSSSPVSRSSLAPRAAALCDPISCSASIPPAIRRSGSATTSPALCTRARSPGFFLLPPLSPCCRTAPPRRTPGSRFPAPLVTYKEPRRRRALSFSPLRAISAIFGATPSPVRVSGTPISLS
jgi:hypothetical protein